MDDLHPDDHARPQDGLFQNDRAKHEELVIEFPILTADEAQWLGDRAQARREELPLSRNALADQIGISWIKLMNWEKSLPRMRRPEEVEWENRLQVPAGWLRLTHLKAYAPPTFPDVQHRPYVTVADEMRAVCRWYARKSLFYRTEQYEALDASEQRMADIMLRRYGVYGEEASTLQNIGDAIGLTRERVRQIAEDFNANLDKVQFATPMLDQLKFVIQSSLPCKVEELDGFHRALLGDALSVQGADRFAREVLGRSIVRIVTRPANMQGHHTTPMAVADDAPDDDDVRAVRQVAQAMVRISGAAQLHFVAGMASSALQRGVTPDEVLRCCRLFSNFEWLSEPDGWFWFGPAADNRAKTTALKVLSVATRNVDVEEIHDAMARARLLRYDPDKPRPYLVDAPLSVLREVLARIPGIEKVQYNDFRLDVLIAPEEVLSDTELALYRALAQQGGAASRQSLIEKVLAVLDVTPMALNLAFDSSPIFVRLDTGVWSIRGNRMNAQSVAAAFASHMAAYGGQGRSAENAAKLVDGWWQLRVAAPDSAFARRHWIVPVAVAELLQPGDYAVDGFMEPASFLVATNPNLGGFMGKLIDAGIGPTEVFLLCIHDTQRRLRFEKLPQQPSATATEP